MFTLTDGAWVQVGADIDGENASDYSGWSVAMNAVGDTVIIGAYGNDGNGNMSGQARVFTLTDGVGAGWCRYRRRKRRRSFRLFGGDECWG